MNEKTTKWLNKQYPWLQEAATRILNKRVLDESDISGLVTMIKTSVSQDVIQENNYPRIEKAVVLQDVIRLVSIGDVQGIEKLAPRNPLTFGDGNLCIIYGHNGSGKSGYVRILKKACGNPRASELKHNVFKEQPTQQKCKITYNINNQEIPAEWITKDGPIDALKSLDVFDNLSGYIYIDSESEPSYIPAELNFFSDLVNVCQAIKMVLETEQDKLVSKERARNNSRNFVLQQNQIKTEKYI